MENAVTFDELSMLNQFKTVILNAFEQDDTHTEKYWYNLFGKKKPRVYYSITEARESTAFPCFVVRMTPLPNVGTIHSSEVEQYTRVDIAIEQYNQQVGNIGKEELGIMINHRLKSVLQSTFKVRITQNNELMNINSTIYRRIIRCSIVYDNINEIIYQGDSYYGY